MKDKIEIYEKIKEVLNSSNISPKEYELILKKVAEILDI